MINNAYNTQYRQLKMIYELFLAEVELTLSQYGSTSPNFM